MSEQKYMPFWGSRIFWIALAVLASFTAMIMAGKLELEGAAVIGFLLAIVTSVVGLSRREQGDAGRGIPMIPPDIAADALSGMLARMFPDGRPTEGEPKPEPEEDDGDADGDGDGDADGDGDGDADGDGDGDADGDGDDKEGEVKP
jgi:hypothetical protein